MVAEIIADSVAADHPSDAQLVALAGQFFKKFDSMSTDASLAFGLNDVGGNRLRRVQPGIP